MNKNKFYKEFAIIIILTFIKDIRMFTRIKEFETDSTNDDYYTDDDEYVTTFQDEFDNNKEIKEYKFDDELQSIFNLSDLLTKPILSGIRDENWPYSFNINITRNECTYCECGIPLPNRIVGGKKTQISEYPWMVMLTYRGRFICGGSLLNDRYVLTAAHCTQGLAVKDLDCRFAESITNEPWTSNAIYRRVESFVRSKNYNTKTMDSDISIIKLKRKISFSNKVRPICLPSNEAEFQKYGMVTGWGAIYSDGPTSSFLRKVQVPLLTNAECRKTAYKNDITENMLCAGRSGKDACQGDSGGPLISFDHKINKHVQIGVVSWGFGCGFDNQPGVYTKVSNFISWIENNSNSKCKCNT